MRRYKLIARFLLQWILFYLCTTAVEQRDKRSATYDRDIKINVLRDWKIWFEAMAIMTACMTSELHTVDSTSTYPTHHTTLQLAAGCWVHWKNAVGYLREPARQLDVMFRFNS